MTHTRCRSILLTLAMAHLLATAALAHDFFLIPETATPAIGETFSVALHVSDTFPGDPVAWRPKRTQAFFLLDAEGRLDLRDAALEGETATARVSLRAAGTSVISLSSEPAYIEIEGPTFEEYLGHEGHEEIIGSRRSAGVSDAPGRERYTRHVKTLVDASGRASGQSLERLGLVLEIVPETNPTALRPGDSLSVQVLTEGKPYPGGYLCATYAGHSKEHDAYAWCGRLDRRGRARVPIQAAGWQLVRITKMIPIAGDPKADWHSDWAALTFEVPEGSASNKGAIQSDRGDE